MKILRLLIVLALVAFGPLAHATIAFVGVNKGTLSNVTVVTAARNATNGDTLVVVGTGWNNSGVPTTLTLTNAGGETVPAAAITYGPTGAVAESKLAIWIIPVAHGGSSNTWTLTASGAISTGSDLNLDVLEYSGCDAAGATDGTNTNQATNVGVNITSVNTGNVVTTNANDLIFTAAWDQSNDQTFTYSASYTGRNNNQNSDAETSDEADRIVSSTGTYSNTFTVVTGSANIISAIVAIKAAGASAITTGTSIGLMFP